MKWIAGVAIFSGLLLASWSSEAATSSGPLANCNSPTAKQFIISGMNQILAQQGASFLKFAVPSMGPGYTPGGNPVCMIGFYDSDGTPMSGQFSYHTNLAGQIVVTFIANPQP